MNDLRIADLVRQAVELDELERDVAGAGQDEQRADDVAQTNPGLRLAHDGSIREARRDPRAERHRILRGVGAGLAVAACAGVVMSVAALLMLPDRGPAKPTIAAVPVEDGRGLPARTPQHSDMRDVVAATAPASKGFTPSADEQCCVVIAMVRDASGVLRCVQWRQHEWDAHRVNGMSAMDLKTAVPSPCMNIPQQMVLVAVTGPTRSLPSTDESAARLASCILGSPRGCEMEGMCFTNAAARCLPNDVSVKVETVGLGR